MSATVCRFCEDDYVGIRSSVTISAGQTEASFTVALDSDSPVDTIVSLEFTGVDAVLGDWLGGSLEGATRGCRFLHIEMLQSAPGNVGGGSHTGTAAR
ncbi:MAG: hypothetical protein AB8B91_19870 [Rubripirellula sp.]